MNLKQIFTEGKKERTRRRAVNRGRGDLKAREADLAGRLTDLGRRAWAEKSDLSAFPDLKAALENRQAEIDGLKQSTDEALKRKDGKEAEKKREGERFGAEHTEAEEKRKEAEGRLNAEKDRLKSLQKELSQAESRAMQIHKEREQLHKKITDAATPAEEKASGEKSLQDLAAEEAGLLQTRKAESETIKAQGEKIVPLQDAADVLQKQVKDILARQKEKLGEFDDALREIEKELGALRVKTKEAENAQAETFRLLGEGLAALGDTPPGLNTELAAVKEARQGIGEIKTRIETLGSQGSPEAASAYKKMMAIVIGAVVFVLALIVLAVILFAPKKKPVFGELADNLIQVQALSGAEAGNRPYRG